MCVVYVHVSQCWLICLSVLCVFMLMSVCCVSVWVCSGVSVCVCHYVCMLYEFWLVLSWCVDEFLLVCFLMCALCL